ncbi:hypothetical protein OH77DRAFT_1216726 [Trametes cingulata]|nr:hypothetical protein OH77DRAFT_1216726 [Trametes cingulata]
MKRSAPSRKGNNVGIFPPCLHEGGWTNDKRGSRARREAMQGPRALKNRSYMARTPPGPAVASYTPCAPLAQQLRCASGCAVAQECDLLLMTDTALWRRAGVAVAAARHGSEGKVQGSLCRLAGASGRSSPVAPCGCGIARACRAQAYLRRTVSECMMARERETRTHRRRDSVRFCGHRSRTTIRGESWAVCKKRREMRAAGSRLAEAPCGTMFC